MESIDHLTEDYSRHRVPDEAAVSGFRIALVIFGAIITLPIFFVGGQLGHSMGFAPSIIAFVLTGVVVATVAIAVGIIATRTRLPTVLIMRYSFGRNGARLVSVIIGLAVLGWYGITLDIFVDAMQTLMLSFEISDPSDYIYLYPASALMILTAIFGFRGLDKVSIFAVPCMILFLLALVYTAIGYSGFAAILNQTGRGMSISQGASAGIGGFIVGVTVFPDLCRYARSERDAVIAASGGIGLCGALVLILATIPSIAAQDSNFLQVLTLFGFGISGLVLILLATWTTNAYNLYSSSLVVANILLKVEKWKLTVMLGLIGTGIALISVLDNFITFLNIIAISIPPIAGVYIADFYIARKQDYSEDALKRVPAYNPAGFGAWITGSLAAYGSNGGVYKLTTVPAIDAMIVAAIAYLIWLRISRQSCHL